MYVSIIAQLILFLSFFFFFFFFFFLILFINLPETRKFPKAFLNLIMYEFKQYLPSVRQTVQTHIRRRRTRRLIRVYTVCLQSTGKIEYELNQLLSVVINFTYLLLSRQVAWTQNVLSVIPLPGANFKYNAIRNVWSQFPYLVKIFKAFLLQMTESKASGTFAL